MLSILPALLLLLLNGTSSCDHLVAPDGARHVVNAGMSLGEVCHALACQALVATASECADPCPPISLRAATKPQNLTLDGAADKLRKIAQETSRDRDGPKTA